LTTLARRAVCALLAASAWAAAGFADEWPGLRGPNHDGSAGRDSRFGSEEGALAVGWRARLGPGYSGIAVSGGRAVTQFADGSRDVVAAFDVASGKEAWRVPLAEAHQGRDGSFDGPISTPAIAGQRVFALGPRGHLLALDLATGRVLWRVDLSEREGARKPHYGFASSPVVSGGLLVAQVGGDKGRAIAGFDPKTGARRWTAGEDGVSYQSPVAVKVGARELVVAAGDAKLIGIDPATGRVAFEHAHGGGPGDIGAGSAVPVPSGDGRVFVKTHPDKSTMFRLAESADGSVSVQSLWTAPVLRTTYVVPVYHDGHLYGMTGRTVFTCVDAQTGEVKWRSREPGDGFPTLVGGDIVFLTKERTLHVGPASPKGWTERARLEVFEDVVWTAPSVAGGSVFARSQGELARVDWKTATAAAAKASSAVAAQTLARFLAEVERAPGTAEKAALVDRFLAAAADGPLVEPPDRVVFLYRGEAADVGIATDLIGMRREDPMRRVPGTDLFYYEARLDPDARVSYQFVRNFEPPMPDPRNPRRVPWTAMSGDASSVAMPGWREPAHLKEAPEARRGRVEKIDVTSTLRPGAKPALHVYLPAGYDASAARHPVAYFVDGDGAREKGLVPRSLDHLMPEKVAPALVVFPGRFEWGAAKPQPEQEGKVSLEILLTEVVPLVDARFRTLAEPRARAIVGNAFGAQAALRAAFHESGLFGALGLQSAAMLDSDETEIFPLIRPAAERPLRVYHDWGRYDAHATREHWDMRATNARLSRYLAEKGHRPAGGEAPDGTGWSSWRNRTDRLFEVLFPPGG
jgi:enterochelin esterase-like enzyme/outer membrane protein assembly factor BamB